MTPEHHEAIGELAEKADNLFHSTKIPMSPETHLKCLAMGLTDIRNRLRAIYNEAGASQPGFIDPWADHPKD